jgi:hypothetical protein
MFSSYALGYGTSDSAILDKCADSFIAIIYFYPIPPMLHNKRHCGIRNSIYNFGLDLACSGGQAVA